MGRSIIRLVLLKQRSHRSLHFEYAIVYPAYLMHYLLGLFHVAVFDGLHVFLIQLRQAKLPILILPDWLLRFGIFSNTLCIVRWKSSFFRLMAVLACTKSFSGSITMALPSFFIYYFRDYIMRIVFFGFFCLYVCNKFPFPPYLLLLFPL